VVRPSERVDIDWAFHMLTMMNLNQYATQSAQPGLAVGNLRGLQFLLPSLAEQRRTADVLDSADALLAKRHQTLSALDNLANSMFVDIVGEHTQWPSAPLGDLCDGPGKYGAAVASQPFVEGIPRYLRITDIHDSGQLNSHRVSPAGPAAAWEGCRAEEGDLLFARSGATVGKAYCVPEGSEPLIFAGYLIRFRTRRDAVLPEFVNAFTHTPVYRAWVRNRMQTVAQPNINAKMYGSLPVPVPPIEVQNRLVSRLETVAVVRRPLPHEPVDVN
jgi:restriction endonuclease S subunit